MLRTSGDVSEFYRFEQLQDEYAPHERRCFPELHSRRQRRRICSARAEMFLVVGDVIISLHDMLRTSGDVSPWHELSFVIKQYAPHERRCFLHKVC